jgi:hypothetical protein
MFLSPRRKAGIELDRRHFARARDQMGHDRGVVTGARADMHDVLACLQAGIGEQFGVQRRLSLVEMPLRQNRELSEITR